MMEVAVMTGTNGPRKVALTVAPTGRYSVQRDASAGDETGTDSLIELVEQIDVTSTSDKTKEPLTTPASGSSGLGVIGLEPMTPSLSI
jgi:hypothetical protein